MPALTPEAHRLAAIVLLVVVWWITEAIPLAITAVVGPALAVVTGVATAQQAFAPFGSPTIFLFIGSFILGAAVTHHGLDRRLAEGLLAVPAIGKSPGRARLGVGALTMAISGWMSNTATTAMMLPVALGVVRQAPRGGGGGDERLGDDGAARRFRIGLLLSIAYAASIGGLLTPVGSPPNLITIGLLETATGKRIDFLRWMLFAAPLTVLLGAAAFVLVRWRFPSPRAASAPRRTRRAGAPRSSPGRAVSATARSRSAWRRCSGSCPASWRWSRPTRRRASCWRRASTRPWSPSSRPRSSSCCPPTGRGAPSPSSGARRRGSTGARSFSSAAGSRSAAMMFESGLAKVIGTGLAEALGAQSRVAVVALAAVLGVLLSELTSNTAATNMVVPVVISLAQARGLDPTLPAIAACFGASLGFMLPISTPPNAIVYGTGMIPIGRMFSTGVLLDLLGLIVVIAGLLVLAPLVVS